MGGWVDRGRRGSLQELLWALCLGLGWGPKKGQISFSHPRLLTLRIATELYKKSDMVFFETSWEGASYNYLVPEEELPMMTSKSQAFVVLPFKSVSLLELGIGQPNHFFFL